ncbi:MFS transporter [Myceligenerans indicum]|uniref:MFS transporter n=1 Tax=Myceligenerans indicum TaxID=2593663 RepID=UPI00191D8817|nr:MFS transporter [Myceligenerans indicum]
MRRHLVTLTASTFVTWTGQRITAVALPLVAIEQTGDAWTTGLVGGFAGLPLLTSAWWGRGLRGRLTSGRSLAVLLVIQAAGLALVPLAAVTTEVNAVVLCASGLVSGAAAALLGPAQRAVTADLSEDVGPGVGPKALAWQDMAHRTSMIFAPPLGAWLVAAGHAVPMLWCEAAGAALAAVAVAGVPRASQAPAAAPPVAERAGSRSVSMSAVLRSRPDLAVGIGLAGIGGVCWFGFTLGLTLLGAELGRPGELIAAGMAGYGVTTVAVSFVLPVVINRIPRLPAVIVPWAVFGLAYMALPVVAPSLAGIALVAAVGGVAMPFGIAGLNALITEQTSGDERRAAFTAETVLHNGGASVGLLAGGAIIGLFGSAPVILVTGLLQVVAAVCAAFWVRVGRRASEPAGDRGQHVTARTGS